MEMHSEDLILPRDYGIYNKTASDKKKIFFKRVYIFVQGHSKIKKKFTHHSGNVSISISSVYGPIGKPQHILVIYPFLDSPRGRVGGGR